MHKPFGMCLKSSAFALILILANGCETVSTLPPKAIPCAALTSYEGPVTEWAVDYELAYQHVCRSG
jgi:hypothetical protein